MRKTLFVLFILLGSAVGVFFVFNESTGLKIVQGGIGALAGAAIGGALASIGCRPRAEAHSDNTDGFTVAQDEQVRNYWLDRGRLTSSPGLPHPDDNDLHSH